MSSEKHLYEVEFKVSSEGIDEAERRVKRLHDMLKALGATATGVEKDIDKAGGSTEKLGTAAKDASVHLPRLRYALQDVSRNARDLGIALGALGIGSAGVAVSMERQFADVLRTTEAYMDSTGEASRKLRSEFNDLFTSLPVSWTDLTDIGSLAGQLGVASESVVEFTRLVTMFSATTGVSVEASATAFGRLSELLGVASYEYQNLGSSILAVGVNSIATENEIISISQQIAGIASTVGMTADEVVGLSSAFASIGTAPELTRGTVTRLFTNIINATAEGGDKLEAFARTAGMTAEQFAQLWGTDATGAVMKLVEGLGRLEGHAAISALRDMGITSVRDVPNILKLSQNYDLLAQSMSIANEGYVAGTFLQENYGVVADTTAAKLEKLKNTFQTIAATFGEAALALTPLIDLFASLANGFRAIIDNPIGKPIAGLVMLLTSVGAVAALAAAGMTRVASAGLAVRTSMVEAAVGMGIYATAADAAGVKTGVLTGQVLRATTAAQGMGTAFKVLRMTSWAGALLTALSAIAAAYDAVTNSSKGFIDEIQGLEEAIQLDATAIENGAESFRTLTVNVEETGRSSTGLTASLAQVLGITEQVGTVIDETTGEVKELNIELGENVARAIAAALVANEDFIKGLKESSDVLAEHGLTIDDVVEGMVKGDVDAVLDPVIQSIENKIRELSITLVNNPADLDAFVKMDEANKALDYLDDLKSSTKTVNEELETAAINGSVAEGVLRGMGYGAEDAAGGVDELTGSIEDFLGESYNTQMATANIQGAMYDLAETLIENGGVIDAYSEEGRANMEALDATIQTLYQNSGEGGVHFADNLANLFAYIGGAGIELSGDIDYVRQLLVNTFNQQYGLDLSTAAARGSLQDFIADAIKAIEALAIIERRNIGALNMRAAGGAGPLMNSFDRETQMAISKATDDQLKTHQTQLRNYNDQISSLKKLQSSLTKVEETGQKAGQQIYKALGEKRGGGGGGGRSGGSGPKSAAAGAKKAKEEVKELTEELYTLSDYANDLSSIWDRAFDIRFSGSQTYDAITNSIREIQERFEDAEQRVRDYRLEMQRLRADLTGMQAELSQQQYFLSIALEYGDTARAEQIQARIAELNANIAEKQHEVTVTGKEMKKAQEETSRTLTGNSKSAIDNRQSLESLVKQYQNHIKALADSGMSSDQLKRRTEQLKNEFVKQATQLGYSRKEINKYTNAFKDVRVAINNVPRNITVKADTNPARQALNEYLARVKKASASAAVKANTKSANDSLNSLLNKAKKGATVPLKASIPSNIGNTGGTWKPNKISSNGPISAPSITLWKPVKVTGTGSHIMSMVALKADGGIVDYLAAGGVSGLHPGRPKGTDTVPAWLTPGEYVIRKQAVNYYGRHTFDALNQMKAPRTAVSGGGAAMAGAGEVFISGMSATVIQAVARYIQPKLYLNDRVIGQANGADARSATSRGRM